MCMSGIIEPFKTLLKQKFSVSNVITDHCNYIVIMYDYIVIT